MTADHELTPEQERELRRLVEQERLTEEQARVLATERRFDVVVEAEAAVGRCDPPTRHQPTFQIRDETFGLSLYEGESASEALLSFLADRVRGELRETIEFAEDGTATAEFRGVRYRAVRADDPSSRHTRTT